MESPQQSEPQAQALGYLCEQAMHADSASSAALLRRDRRMASDFVTLKLSNVSNRGAKLNGIPQVARTSILSPNIGGLRKIAGVAQTTRGARFELIPSNIGMKFAARQHDMHVIRPHIGAVQRPAANGAVIRNGSIDDPSLPAVEADRHVAQALRLGVTAPIAERSELSTRRVASEIDASAPVAGQPGAVAGPRKQVGQRRGHGQNNIRTNARRQVGVRILRENWAPSHKYPRACAWGSDSGARRHG